MADLEQPLEPVFVRLRVGREDGHELCGRLVGRQVCLPWRFPRVDSRWGARKARAVTARRPRMKIGQEFTHCTTHQRWRVTDVGTRPFLAVRISDPQVEADPSWLNGPPYAVAEEVWDEDSFGALEDVAGIEWD